MVTPFDAAGKVDYPVLSSLVEWYIASGCSGLFAVCQSSEMYYLDEAERLEVAGFVAKQAAGRVAVVATGNSGGGTIGEQAAFVNKMAAVPGMDAVVALTCMFAAEDESEEVWKANATKLMALTTCSLGLYEVPVPYKRVLSPGLLAWCASSGRFLFHKDTCSDSAQIEAKINAVKALGSKAGNFRFYNANIETILFSNGLGGAGFSGISGNFYPFIMSALCPGKSQNKSLREEDRQNLQAFISLAEVAIVDQYPYSAKKYLAQYPNLPIRDHCRSAAFPAYSEVQNAHIAGMKKTMELVCKHAGIAVVEPSMSGQAAKL